jgi:hypothetical protein
VPLDMPYACPQPITHTVSAPEQQTAIQQACAEVDIQAYKHSSLNHRVPHKHPYGQAAACNSSVSGVCSTLSLGARWRAPLALEKLTFSVGSTARILAAADSGSCNSRELRVF